MDINNRDAAHEKNERTLKSLKESYKGMFKTFSQELLNEDAFSAGKKLKSKQKVEMKEEGNPFAKKDDEKEDAEPKEDTPKDDAAPEGDVPPVSTDTPEGGDLDSQDQLSTREFAAAFLKGLPSDVDLQNSVDANGVFKASVNDQQHGQFTIVAFPSTKNLHQVADLVEPALPGAAAGAEGGLPPVDPAAGAVPPVAGAEGGLPPVDQAAGGLPPVAGDVVPPAPVAKPEEPVVKEVHILPVVKEVVAPAPAAPVVGGQEADCQDPRCMDPNCKVHGMDAGAMMESEREKQRDPILEGRKNWNSMVKKLLTEGKAALKKEDDKKNLTEDAAVSDISKLEARVKSIESLLASETDADEKKALQIDLGKAKMTLSRAKNPTKVVSDGEDA